MRQAANENGTGNENTQPTPEADRFVEVGEDSNSSTGPATAATAATKISKEQPKTAAAIRKTQKAKQKENIEQKMLALLSKDRDKEDDEIELAFASIAKRAKVELDQKAKYKFIDAVNGLYAKFSSGEALAPPLHLLLHPSQLNCQNSTSLQGVWCLATLVYQYQCLWVSATPSHWMSWALPTCEHRYVLFR